MGEVFLHGKEARRDLIAQMTDTLKPSTVVKFGSLCELGEHLCANDNYSKVNVAFSGRCANPEHLSAVFAGLKGKNFIIYMIGNPNLSHKTTQFEKQLVKFADTQPSGCVVRVTPLSSNKFATQKRDNRRIKTMAKLQLSPLKLGD